MKKIINIVLTTMLLLTLVSSMSFANYTSEATNDIVNDFTFENFEGKMFKDNWSEIDTVNLNLKELNVDQNNGIIKTKGEFGYSGKLYSIDLSGILYPITGQGIYSDKLLLGDMDDTNDFNVLQFRVEKDSKKTALLSSNYVLENQTVLTIVLEDKINNNIIYLQDSISETIFDSLFLGAKYQLKQDDINENELIEKTMELSNMNNKTSNSNQQSKIQEISEEEPDGDVFSITSTIAVDYGELKRLLSDLKTNNTVNLLNYNIPESLFKGSGWKSYTDWSLASYFYHAYSGEQSWYTLTQISMVDIKNN